DGLAAVNVAVGVDGEAVVVEVAVLALAQAAGGVVAAERLVDGGDQVLQRRALERFGGLQQVRLLLRGRFALLRGRFARLGGGARLRGGLHALGGGLFGDFGGLFAAGGKAEQQRERVQQA